MSSISSDSAISRGSSASLLTAATFAPCSIRYLKIWLYVNWMASGKRVWLTVCDTFTLGLWQHCVLQLLNMHTDCLLYTVLNQQQYSANNVLTQQLYTPAFKCPKCRILESGLRLHLKDSTVLICVEQIDRHLKQ